MPILKCGSKGKHPKGLADEKTGKCPHWYEDGTCNLEMNKPCVFQSKEFTETEIAAKEHVEKPEAIKEIKQSLDGFSSSSIVPTASIKESVDLAMSLINKINPVGKTKDREKYSTMWGYWQDGVALEFDMGQLSSLLAHIAALHAEMKSKLKSAISASKAFRAKKYSNIKRSYSENLRKGKPSDKAIEYEIENDKEYKDMQEAITSAESAVMLLDAALSSINSHIQVLKKRRETLMMERQESGGPRPGEKRF